MNILATPPRARESGFLATLAPADLYALIALAAVTGLQVLGVLYLCLVHEPRPWEWDVPLMFVVEWIKRNWDQLGSSRAWILAGAASFLVQLGLVSYLGRRTLRFAFKSLRRNIVRTILTALSIIVLVFVITLIWTVLVFLDLITSDKAKDFKAIVTEKFQIPSQMPYAYAEALRGEALDLPAGLRPGEKDLMSWQFYGGNIEPDPAKRTRETLFFAIAMEPSKLRTMMDDLEGLEPGLEDRLAAKRNGCILGRDKLKAANKKVGETFKLTSMNYKGIDLEFEIVGVFPPGRYDLSMAMNRDYLVAALEKYQKDNNGTPHPMASKTLNLYWMRLPSSEAFTEMGARIMSPGKFASPAVKFETASSGIASWLDGYRTLIWGMRWLLSPAILFTMTLVVANAISISVRERRTEMAVLKVLGYGPGRILMMILTEALLIGAGSGLLSAGLSYLIVHVGLGGIKFPVAFFPVFDIYIDALWWGLLIGCAAGFFGSILPAWSARKLKVSEVFAKTA